MSAKGLIENSPMVTTSAIGRIDGTKENALSKSIFKLRGEHFEGERGESRYVMP